MIDIFGLSFPILWLHLTTLGFTIVVIFTADSEGMMWMRGKKERLNEKKLNLLHRLMWTGLSLMIITGLSMFWPLREFLLHSTAFYVKMFFVLTIAINGVFIGKLSRVSTEKAFKDLSRKERSPLFVSGAVSTLSWLGAIVAATNLGI